MKLPDGKGSGPYNLRPRNATYQPEGCGILHSLGYTVGKGYGHGYGARWGDGHGYGLAYSNGDGNGYGDGDGDGMYPFYAIIYDKK